MRNLHSIKHKINLTEEELAILAYCELGNETGWRFKIGEDNRLWCKDYEDEDEGWYPVADKWSYVLPLRVWEELGRFEPNLSVLE